MSSVVNETKLSLMNNVLLFLLLSRGSSKSYHSINYKLIFCEWYPQEKILNTGKEYGYGYRKKFALLSTGTETDTDYFQKMKYGKCTGTDRF